MDNFDELNFSDIRKNLEDEQILKNKKIKAELKLLRLKYARLKYKYNQLSSDLMTPSRPTEVEFKSE